MENRRQFAVWSIENTSITSLWSDDRILQVQITIVYNDIVKYCNVRSNGDIIHETNVFVLFVYTSLLGKSPYLFCSTSPVQNSQPSLRLMTARAAQVKRKTTMNSAHARKCFIVWFEYGTDRLHQVSNVTHLQILCGPSLRPAIVLSFPSWPQQAGAGSGSNPSRKFIHGRKYHATSAQSGSVQGWGSPR